MNIALSIGGSVLGDLNLGYLRKLADLLNKLADKHKFYLVVGGGELARKCISICRELGSDEAELDRIGIAATRLNARVLIAALKNSYPEPVKNFEEALIAGKNFKFVVGGGTHPGHTTDAVTAMLAERCKAQKLIIMTDVDGIYTADPKKDKQAKLLEKVSYEELVALAIKSSIQAGAKSVIDPLAAKIIARAKLPALVINGKKLENLEALIEGKEFVGTTIGGD